MLDEFDSWVFVRAHGTTYVGKWDGSTEKPRLLSVFEYEEHRQLTPQGMASATNVRPVMNFLSLRQIPMPAGVECWVKDMIPDEKRAACKLIRETVAQLDKARAEAAGIRLAGANDMPKRPQS